MCSLALEPWVAPNLSTHAVYSKVKTYKMCGVFQEVEV
jgi:hypothetical protein